jgi:DNA repair protein RecN (Recombination protein N)
VTHLAAIAAKGDNNLYVDKGIQNDRTITRITKLNEEEVLNEIARIISGGNISDAAIMHAKELRKNDKKVV